MAEPRDPNERTYYSADHNERPFSSQRPRPNAEQKDAASSSSTNPPNPKQLSPNELLNQETSPVSHPAEGVTDQIGHGFKTEVAAIGSVAGISTIQRVFWGSSKRKGVSIATSLLLMGLSVFGIVTVAEGPFQLIQLAHVLEQPLALNQKNDAQSASRLMKYVGANDAGETRVGILGRQYLRKTLSELDSIGINFKTDPGTGALQGASIDTTKLSETFPELKGMTAEEQRTWLAEKFHLSSDQIIGEGGNFSIDSTDFPFKASIALKNDALSFLGDGVIETALKQRLLAQYLDVPSLFHPIQRAKAATNRKIATLAEEKAAAEEEDQSLAAPEEAQADTAVAEVNTESEDYGNPLSKVLLVDGTACFVRGIAAKIETIDRFRVLIPAAIMATRLIAVGSQVQSGQDISNHQLAGIEATLTNSKGQTVWGAQALQAEEGISNPSAPDLSPSMAQAFNPQTATTITDWVDNALGGTVAADALCSKPGQLAQAAAGLVLVGTEIMADVESAGSLTPALVAQWATQIGAGFAVSAVGMHYVAKFVLNKTTAATLAKDAFSGPSGGNLLAYGARAAAGIGSVASGGIPLANSTSTQFADAQAAASQQQFQSESLFARIFNLNDYRSLFGRLADSISPSIMTNISRLSIGLANITNSVPHVFSDMFPKVYAQASPYNWNFPAYGIPPQLMNNPTYANPYANAAAETNLLNNKAIGPALINEASVCFGDTITNTSGYWDVIPNQSVDTASQQYLNEDCSNITNQNWARTIMFVHDTMTMKSMACYMGSTSSCSDLGMTG